MDNIKNVKWIENPYKKLNLVENKDVRVQAIKEVAEFFGTEIKTRKRANTKIENKFYNNEELKELLNKTNITPVENQKIQEQILSDLENIQKDIWIVEKNKKKSLKFSWKYKSITWFNIRKQLKDKLVIPIGKKTWQFISNNKIKLSVWVIIIATTSYGTHQSYNNFNNNLKANTFEDILNLTNNDNSLLNLSLNQDLDGDSYNKVINKLWELDLNRKIKFKSGTVAYKQFDDMYWKLMWKLQDKKNWKFWKVLTKNEWKAYLAVQYIATNSYIDKLKSNSDTLKASELKKNNHLILSYKMQLNDIKNARSDLLQWKNWEVERQLNSWTDTYTFYTNLNWNFHLDWLDRRIYK